jgi:hypothetical protein
MKLFDLKKMAAVSALGLAFLMGMSETSSAQNRGNNRDWQKQQRAEQERAKAEQERIRQEQERQAEMDRRNNDRGGNDRDNNGRSNNGRGNGSWGNNNNGNSSNGRYRVNRNGSYYNTDGRGAEMLRQAVRSGYEQGFRAGQNDRNSRRRSNWTSNNDYRSGSYGYDSHVARNQYQYYFQQGFQRGYQDGFNRRNQYGSYNTNNGGGGGILSAILNQILNIQTY